MSWAISSYVLYIAFTKGRQMLQYGEPDISSIAEEMNYGNVGKVNFGDISLPLLEIVEGGDTTVNLE
jgi:hypothetical protein